MRIKSLLIQHNKVKTEQNLLHFPSNKSILSFISCHHAAGQGTALNFNNTAQRTLFRLPWLRTTELLQNKDKTEIRTQLLAKSRRSWNSAAISPKTLTMICPQKRSKRLTEYSEAQKLKLKLVFCSNWQFPALQAQSQEVRQETQAYKAPPG